jgi:putative ABC transport system permease protein
MFKRNLVISIRNLLKNKVFTVVNIFGLAVGMAACFAILQYVRFELSYDRFHKDADRIYRVILEIDHANHRAANHSAAGPALKRDFPEIVEYTRAAHQSIFITNQVAWSYTDKQGDTKVFNLENAYFVDTTFLTMFSFPFIYGDPASVLRNPDDIAISRSLSQKFFGSENPLGRELKINSRWPLIVRGVFEDIPQNSSMQFDVLVRLELGTFNESWVWPGFYTFIKLDSLADVKKLQSEMQNFCDKYLGDVMKKFNFHSNFILQPLTDIHLKSPDLTEERAVLGNIRTVYFLVVIAILILVIALINYINLSTAKSVEREQEIGLKKVAGATRKQLIFQFLFESALINTIALILSVFLLIIFLPSFNHLTGKNIGSSDLILNLFRQTDFWISLTIIYLAGSFLAGIYPAFVLSGFSPVNMLKGGHQPSKGGITYRKILVGFQFFISLALIAGTMVVYKQVMFMRNQSLGFDKDHIIVIKSPAVIDSTVFTRLNMFRNELKRNPQIENFATSTQIPGEWISNLDNIRSVDKETKDAFTCHFYSIDDEFFNTYGIELVAGRNFKNNEYSRIFDLKNINPVIVNEETVKRLGFANPQESISKRITYKYGNTENVVSEIIGVVKNFHQRSLKENYDPLLFHSLPGYSVKYFSVRYVPGNIHNSIEYLRDQFNTIFPGNYFEYFFLNDYFDDQYKTDNQFGRVFATFTIIAIIIAYLGLFGLITYIISTRTKEIAIRRVMGSLIKEILVLFAWDFVILIMIASITALPCVYFLGRNWLNNFTFKTDIGWLVFIAPVLILLAITLLTTSIQTIKTSNINPAETIKYE